MHKETGLSIIRVVNDLKLDGDDPLGVAAAAKGVMHFEPTENNPAYVDLDRLYEDAFSPEGCVKGGCQSSTMNWSIFFDSSPQAEEQALREEYSRRTRSFWYGDNGMPSTLYEPKIDSLEKKGAITHKEAMRMRNNYYGFARIYGKKSISEDKATVAETLFYPETIGDRLETDVVLAKKVEFMKQEYFLKSRGTMNETYWKIVQEKQFSPQQISDYLDLQREILNQMSDEALIEYVAEETGKTLSGEELAKWRETLA